MGSNHDSIDSFCVFHLCLALASDQIRCIVLWQAASFPLSLSFSFAAAAAAPPNDMKCYGIRSACYWIHNSCRSNEAREKKTTLFLPVLSRIFIHVILCLCCYSGPTNFLVVTVFFCIRRYELKRRKYAGYSLLFISFMRWNAIVCSFFLSLSLCFFYLSGNSGSVAIFRQFSGRNFTRVHIFQRWITNLKPNNREKVFSCWNNIAK